MFQEFEASFFLEVPFQVENIYSITLYNIAHLNNKINFWAAQVGTELVEATKNYDAEALIGLQKDQIFTFLQVEAIQKSSDGPTEWTIGTVDSGFRRKCPIYSNLLGEFYMGKKRRYIDLFGCHPGINGINSRHQ